MIEDIKNITLQLDEEKVKQISSFAQQMRTVDEIRQMFDDSVVPNQTVCESNKKCVSDEESVRKGLETDMVADQEKLDILKKIPKAQLEMMGFGDIKEVLPEEEFLDRSEISDNDFEVL